ncbi:MAG: NAD-dependent epimerase/dehydratase family protein [Solirubrobacteraceae bacterium]
MPSLLVLGGSHFVGRAVVAAALDRDWQVVTFNRGGTAVPAGVEHLRGDRLDPGTLAPLASRDWDLVIDTWSGAPRAVRDSTHVLRERAAHYAYVSSGSVYTAPPTPGARESTPTVEGDPDGDDGEYPELKRGGELAVTRTFGDRALLARAGLILGPWENIGRLTWWLARMARGGEILCPGPSDLPLQYIDARDLAAFLIDAPMAGHSGPFNVISHRGHATTASLLSACRDVAGAPGVELTWVAPETIVSAGIEPWEELPIWIPPGHEYAAMHDYDVERAHAAGLRCRPVADTVADTWRWLESLGAAPVLRPGRPAPGLSAERERATLAAWHTSQSAR